MDTHLLRSFVQIVESGSITRAAEQLNLTQSAVSAQLQKLEEQAGCCVLERSTRSQNLTVQGELLLEHARGVLERNELILTRISSSPRQADKIRIGCSEGFVASWLFPIISKFSRKFPDTEISLLLGITTELNASIQSGELDLMVGAICEEIDGAEYLWSEPLIWVYASNSEPKWEKPLPLAFFPEPCPYRKAAITSLEKSEVPWRIACTSPSSSGVQAAARAGLAIAPLTRSSLAEGLTALPDNCSLPCLPEANFAMVLSNKRKRNSVRELKELIRSSPV